MGIFRQEEDQESLEGKEIDLLFPFGLGNVMDIGKRWEDWKTISCHQLRRFVLRLLVFQWTMEIGI